MYILGISCWYHDSAAALIKDGSIIAASEEERFSRKKHDFDFPVNAIDFCLAKAGIVPDDIEYVVFYDKPLIKFERIISSIMQGVPNTRDVFREAVPLWLTEKLKFRKKVRKTLRIRDDRVLFCFHHLSHAASCFLLSPFEEAAILTVDGVGEWATASLGLGRSNSLTIRKEMRFPNSLGLLYSVFTAFLGFKVNNGEYKVMGMAPYGKPEHVDKIRKIVNINEDGSIELDLEFFSFQNSVSESYSERFIELFGEPRKSESLFFTGDTEFPVYYGEKPRDFEEQARKNQYYADIAASIQEVLEEALLKMAVYLQNETGLDNLCYSGGVALNSKANYRLIKDSGFENVYIQPASTDAGAALGAALWCWCVLLKNSRNQIMDNVYFGSDYGLESIEEAVKEKDLGYRRLSDEELYDVVTDAIISGKVVGWYQGRTEWGPRALGNRSILADPRDAGMKNKVNTVIKFREPYRPFAPSILAEDTGIYVEDSRGMYPDMFMLVTYPVKEEKREVIPAVTHVNGTARIQAVRKEANPRYWSLINRFKEKTGVGVLLNTSFNLKGEPIVNTPGDAIKTFLDSGLDMLVMDNILVEK